ncbi:hypothetical protein EDWATA_02598 [Edwardsiella tarda ATCC 23685]|uniref:Uncharacterized protein n=1 Tax=Edwardsiella tarda ATCC 23685 TaxID=500638 RepID=D4F763_EDWTA|nr:hypothetical protein EDWATA_02598 [Edwardsiella tarda ATCC 23685]
MGNPLFKVAFIMLVFEGKADAGNKKGVFNTTSTLFDLAQN